MTEHEPDTEYTRFRANIQLGDGPDQRGDMTVETSRAVDSNANRKHRNVTVPDGTGGEMEVDAPVNDAAFAEFYMECTRAREVLHEVLGLDQ